MYTQTNIPPCINPVPLSAFLPGLVDICREYDKSKPVAERSDRRLTETDFLRKQREQSELRQEMIFRALNEGLDRTCEIVAYCVRNGLDVTKMIVRHNLTTLAEQKRVYMTGWNTTSRWHVM